MSAELTKLFADRAVPMALTLGLELVDVDPDKVVARVIARDELSTSSEAMHGGAIMAVADTLGAIGTVANMPRGARTTTIESKTNFFRAVPAGSTLTAESTPLHKGRTTQVWQTRLTGRTASWPRWSPRPRWCFIRKGSSAAAFNRPKPAIRTERPCPIAGAGGVPATGSRSRRAGRGLPNRSGWPGGRYCADCAP